MKILALSDLHGRWYKQAGALIRLHDPDWIVLLGDMLPDFTMVSGARNRLECQQAHWQTQAALFESPRSPTTFIRGNREVDGFIVPSRFQSVPTDIAVRLIRLEGIPTDFGRDEDCRPYTQEELEGELRVQVHENPGASVVISHVPPYGCLDEPEPDAHIGHRPLASLLRSGEFGPDGLVLCGHVHESFGIGYIPDGQDRKTLVVNAAEGYALVSFQEGRWKVLRMETMSDLVMRLTHLESDEDAS